MRLHSCKCQTLGVSPPEAEAYPFSYTTGVILLVAVLAGVGFIIMESRVVQLMLNLALFRNLTFSSASASALLNFMSQYVMVFLTPFYLQRVLH